MTMAIMSDRAICEAVLFFEVLLFIHNAVYHGAAASASEIGRARLRSLRLRDSRCDPRQ
jgi:hypothetical protein